MCAESIQVIVADYWKLEARLLAHLTLCEPLIAGFASRRDFNSHTTPSIYKEIQDAVAHREVVLERWDGFE